MNPPGSLRAVWAKTNYGGWVGCRMWS